MRININISISKENYDFMNIVKLIYLSLAFICTGIGAVGIVLPILPTVPFLLLASFFFAKGSERFHKWFVETKLYKNHLDSFVKSRGMTLKSKLCILLPVSGMLILTIIFLNHVHARIFLVCLIIFKYVYFFTRIKTLSEEEVQQNLEAE